MSLKPKPLPPLTPQMRSLAEQVLPVQNIYRLIGDQLADFISDDAFVALYHREGKPALSPALLALVTVFQAVENLSDRQAALMVAVRLDWKYALHLPLDYPGFNYSVLSEFRDRLVSHQAQSLVFDQLLKKLKALGLVQGRGVQRTDSLAIISAVRNLTRLELLIETLRKALTALEVAAPHWFVQTIPAEWAVRYGEVAQQERLVKDKGEKGQAEAHRLSEQTAQDGIWLIGQLEASEPAHAEALLKLPAVQVLQQVWTQQIEWRADGGSGQLRQKLVVNTTELIQSPHDPQARYAQKRGKAWQGYKMQLSETVSPTKPHLITDITTTVASESDQQALGLIQKRLEARGLSPRLELVDSGYMSGENLASSLGRGIKLHGPLGRDSSWQARTEGGLALAEFEVDYELQQARCPAGQTSQIWSEGGAGSEQAGMINIRFNGALCGGCQLRDQCVRSQNPKAGRSLKLQAQHRLLAAQRIEQETPEFKALYAKRAGVEASLSEMVRSSGVRVTRYLGLAKVSLGNLLVGAGTNLKRAAKWLAGIRPVPKRARGFKSLGS